MSNSGVSDWSLNDVITYFREDPEIAAGLSAPEFKEIFNYNKEFLSILKTAFEYQGFDPRTIIKRMLRSRANYLADHVNERKWDMANTSGNFEWLPGSSLEGNLFSSKGSFSRDIEFLVMIFLYRNNHISKIIEKSVEGIADILEMLKEKYEINDEFRASGTSLKSKDITLPRIAGSFPAVAVRMFHDKAAKEIVPYSSVPGSTMAGPVAPDGSETVVDKLTHAIVCPFLPSLHPETASGHSNIHAIMLFVAVKLDDVIHKKEGNFTALDNLITYYRAGYKSAATPKNSRVEVMRKIGLMSNSSQNFTQAAISVNTDCFTALREMRTDDPHHSVMMEIARTGFVPE